MAKAFPGALRELEVCTAALLRQKGAAVERALATGEVPSWVEVVLDFHHELREALAVKLWLAMRLGKAGRVTEAVVAEYAKAHGGTADPAFLERHLHPPGGRVLSLVWEAVGAKHGMTAEEIRQTVFGPLV